MFKDVSLTIVEIFSMKFLFPQGSILVPPQKNTLTLCHCLYDMIGSLLFQSSNYASEKKKHLKYTEALILSNFNQMFIIYALEKVVFTSINERVAATAEAGIQRSFQQQQKITSTNILLDKHKINLRRKTSLQVFFVNNNAYFL